MPCPDADARNGGALRAIRCPTCGLVGHLSIAVGTTRVNAGRSVIVTTNIEFSKWGVLLGDDKVASDLIDRLVHHGRLVEYGGAIRRMERALMLGKGRPCLAARSTSRPGGRSWGGRHRTQPSARCSAR